MSLLFGRQAPREPEDREMVLPPAYMQALRANFGSVNATNGDTALRSVAVRATADLIASLVSELPAEVYRNGKRLNSQAPDSVEDPGGDGFGREDWLYRLMMSYLIRGNSFGFEVEWDSHGRTRAVDLVSPYDVYPVQRGQEVEWYHNGKKLEGADLAHFKHWRTNPAAGRLLGMSIVEYHATAINVSLSSSLFGEQWFKDGAHPSGMLVNAEPLTPEVAKVAKDRFMAATSGTREPVVLGKGWSFDAIQITPEESQFLETQRFTAAECARMFGPGFAEIMGYETGGSMTYANVVDRRQDLLVLSMNKWIRRADRILTSLLPPNTLTVRLNRDALLEATALQRFQAHEIALRSRWRTVNEVRAIEDLDPVAWGDEPNAATTNNAQGVTSGDAA